MPDITKELFNHNQIILRGIGIVFNACILLLNILIMSFIEKIVYKLVTKKTLTNNECKLKTFELFIPVVFTHAILIFLVNILNIDSVLLSLLFLNPLIYYLQFRSLKEIDGIIKKIVLILPFICYSILDIISIFNFS